MTDDASARSSLVRILTFRLAVTALLAMILQLSIVVLRTYLVDDDLTNSFVARSAEALLKNLRARPDGPAVKRQRLPSQYLGQYADSYAFRILDAEGHTLAQHNSALLSEISPWSTAPPKAQDLWLRNLDRTRKLFMAGGSRQSFGDKSLWIEVATLGDPARVYRGVLALEVLDDVWMPMIPLVVLSLGVTTLTVRRSLMPLVAAAARAHSLSPMDRANRFDTSAMPREAASLAAAINELLDRAADLMSSQRMFIARAAHELRTPLAVMMLELGHIGDPRARRLEKDVRSMSEIVDRLLILARLENAEIIEGQQLDIGKIAADIVDRIAHATGKCTHRITLNVNEPASLYGDPAAVREALRNLVENACRHTPNGTCISVQVGPGGCIVVEDSGPGLEVAEATQLLEPFRKGRASDEGAGLGLAIVRQAVDLHRGTLKISRSSMGGARFDLSLQGPADKPKF